MIRVKQRSSGTYTLTCPTLDDDGQPVTVEAPFAVQVHDGAGVLVVDETPDYADDTLSVTVNVDSLPLLDTYQATWSGTVNGVTVEWATTVELVGGYLFELTDLRARDRAFTDAEKYPTSVLASVRVQVEDVIEGPKAAAVAFVPRGRRTTVDGRARQALALPDFEVRQVYAVTVDGTAWTQEQLDTITVDDASLWLPIGQVWPAGHRNVTVHYAHGLDTPPAPITRAALTLAREYLAGSDLPGRATATSVGDQMFRLTIAGRDGVTGLPDVDAAIDQHGRKRFAIG